MQYQPTVYKATTLLKTRGSLWAVQISVTRYASTMDLCFTLWIDWCFCKRSWLHFWRAVCREMFWGILLHSILLDLRTCMESNWQCGWQMCLSSLSLSPVVLPSLKRSLPTTFLLSLFLSFFPYPEVECCITLWPSASWLCPGHRTARCPTSRSCRTLTGTGWVGNVTRSYMIIFISAS